MAIVRYENKWNPWKEMEELQSRLSQVFGTGGSKTRVGGGEGEGLASAEWSPLVDIVEDQTGYLIKAELPEVAKEDVSVRLQNGVLSIEGERKLEREDNNKKYHRVERVYGRFTRTFTLPDDADAEKITAEFKEGVLRVHLGKAEAAKPKQVEVRVS